MINFSSISKKTLIGNLLRFFLKIIPSDFIIPIMQGRLKGKKWIKGSGTNAYWLGSYEPKQVKCFEKFLRKGDVVFDIGANVGFYSFLSAELAGGEGRIFSFEPFPKNFENLQKHIEINAFKNITAINAAVADRVGYTLFSKGESNETGYLSDKGEIKVKTIAMDVWIKEKKLPIPDVLKIDVEGAEALVLKGAKLLIKEFQPLIFLSIHNEKAKNECFAILRDCGYNFKLTGDLYENDKIFIF